MGDFLVDEDKDMNAIVTVIVTRASVSIFETSGGGVYS